MWQPGWEGFGGKIYTCMSFPGGSNGKKKKTKKNPPANAGDIKAMGSILSRRSPGGGNGNPLQYSCLKNPMDREAWQAKAQEACKNQT